MYEEQIDLKRAFIAHLEDNPEDKIFVKFACHYGEDAHAHSYVPKLRAVAMVGSWRSWIMSHINIVG